MLVKYFRLFGLASLLLVCVGCASQGPRLNGSSPSASLIGVWEMVDDQGVPTGNKKILTQDHFAFGKQVRKGIWAGGGTWALVDGFYFETLEYHSAPAVVGVTIKFDFLLENGLWYHEGRFKAGGENFHVKEIWRRVKDD